jgi:alpha/beta superfamily hydrolase
VVVKIPTTHNDTLEGRMIVAEATSLYSELGVILCHPMPLLGGNLDNNVVTAIYFTCASKLRCSTLRFNFRGVGASTGRGSWRGEKERDDVLSCRRYLVEQTPARKIVLVGYSYGSVIAASVADESETIIGYAAVSYPFGPLRLMLLGPLLDKAKSKKPKFFITGAKDNFTSPKKFQHYLKHFPEPLEYHIIEDEDHFWSGTEEKITQYLLPWIESTVRTTSTAPSSLHCENTNNTNACPACSQNKL